MRDIVQIYIYTFVAPPNDYGRAGGGTGVILNADVHPRETLPAERKRNEVDSIFFLCPRLAGGGGRHFRDDVCGAVRHSRRRPGATFPAVTPTARRSGSMRREHREPVSMSGAIFFSSVLGVWVCVRVCVWLSLIFGGMGLVGVFWSNVVVIAEGVM